MTETLEEFMTRKHNPDWRKMQVRAFRGARVPRFGRAANQRRDHNGRFMGSQA